jgi:hypothetical protein
MVSHHITKRRHQSEEDFNLNNSENQMFPIKKAVTSSDDSDSISFLGCYFFRGSY